MSDPGDLSAKEFGASFKGFLEKVAQQAPEVEPPFRARLREHFGCDPATLPIVSEQFDKSEHPNLQTAIDSFVNLGGRRFELLGVAGDTGLWGIKLSQLLSPASGGLMGRSGAIPGPVQYRNVSIGGDRVLSCVESGLYLIAEGAARLALLVTGAREIGFSSQIAIELMAGDQPAASSAIAAIRTAMRKSNVYRGQVVSLRRDGHQLQVDFHRLPKIARADIILPDGLLDRVERLTIRFSEHREKLAAAKRHLKRGLLLYGPPGTGKTLTAMYLAGRTPERTTILLTGGGLGLVEEACAMARTLQPATLVLEDVDLIAEERTAQRAHHAVLFQLLNQMDGLADDADLLFLLTTNRPEMLEPALASRPGRIDQAIEIPLPDPVCRQRLLALYGEGMTVDLKDEAKLVERTKGASAAFIRELLRKAALFAADDSASGAGLVVRDRHFDEALYELVVQGGALTKSLLGVANQAND